MRLVNVSVDGAALGSPSRKVLPPDIMFLAIVVIEKHFMENGGKIIMNCHVKRILDTTN